MPRNDSDILDKGIVKALFFIIVENLILDSGEINLNGGQTLLFCNESKETTFWFEICQFNIILNILAILVIDEDAGDIEELGFAILG